MQNKKKIIIEEDGSVINAQKDNIKIEVNRVLKWIFYMFGYSLILIIASQIFRSLYVETIFWGFLAAIIIYILNLTVKPILFRLTLPIIALTLGIFYLILNLFILKIVDFALGSHFEMNGFISPLFISIFISLMNIILESIIKKIFKKKVN